MLLDHGYCLTMKPKCTLKRKEAYQLINWHKWLPITVLASMVTLNLVGLLLVIRRFSGAFHEPFPTGPMLLTALVSTTLVAYGRNGWRRHIAWRGCHERQDRNARQAMGTSHDCPRAESRYENSHWTHWNPWIGWASSMGLALMAVGCALSLIHI